MYGHSQEVGKTYNSIGSKESQNKLGLNGTHIHLYVCIEYVLLIWKRKYLTKIKYLFTKKKYEILLNKINILSWAKINLVFNVKSIMQRYAVLRSQ